MRKILLVFLFFALPLWAQNAARLDGVTQGPRGPLANQIIAVCSQPANITTQPCSPLLTVYTSTSAGAACTGTLQVTPTIPGGSASSCSNPMLSDSLGNFHFYAAPGQYTVQIYGPSVFNPFIMEDQSLFLPAQGGTITINTVNCTLGMSCILTSAPSGWTVTGNLTVSGTGTINGGQSIVNQNGSVTAGHIGTWVGSGGQLQDGGPVPNPGTVLFTGSTYTNSTSIFTTIPNITFAVGANQEYYLHCDFLENDGSGIGIAEFQFTGPASFSALTTTVQSMVSSGVSPNVGVADASAFSTIMTPGTDCTGACTLTISMMLENGSSPGTVALQGAINSTGAGKTLTISPGACRLN